MFNNNFALGVSEGTFITALVDGFVCVATVYVDDSGDRPDVRDAGFWPSRDESAAGYVLPENFDIEQAKAERVMAAWENDEWFYCGVAVTVSRADVQLTGQYDHALWGVECNYPDSDNSYLTSVANELLSEALFSARAKLAELCK